MLMMEFKGCSHGKVVVLLEEFYPEHQLTVPLHHSPLYLWLSVIG
jgi:hypothetical protein